MSAGNRNRFFKDTSSLGEIFWAFLRLGITSFGGPIAHIGYFRQEFVERRKWLGDDAYSDIVALCQFLPGPASSQVGIALGILRSGLTGGLVAWVSFTLPSAILLISFSYAVSQLGDLSQLAWLHGLKVIAVAVVAQAVWGMARTLCPDRTRATIAIIATLIILAVPSVTGQLCVIVAGGLIGWSLVSAEGNADPMLRLTLIGQRTAISSLVAFSVLLLGLPLAAKLTHNHTLEVISGFYRVGSLVFGGGHVVLPLLQQVVVPSGWIDNNSFLAGYGAAQAVPGPLFTFAAYLGSAMKEGPNGWIGGLICLTSIFLPSFLILVAVLPFWDMLRNRAGIRAILSGINAAVVGLLIAALYTPVWTSAIFEPADFGLVILAFFLLVFCNMPPGLVVVFGGICSTLIMSLTTLG
ncbi:MAG: chromate efflux transporter [Methylocystis sp.]